ncbi:hypothetical protein [Intestinirhabdus alba]|uniref:Uncharacterized protein n=1 Tax=Intestinirhabdus alba TaxID=2899544 RepID=A0A6L6IJ05_9ENTR|nr:hypothetical protein [Intestinirhabdus alba]MTH46821.1 hypothetical protein [Intestinirhabdus alba]
MNNPNEVLFKFGNYMPDWPQMVSQTTKNTVSIFGVESKLCMNNSIAFGTLNNMVNIGGVVVDGRAESSLSIVTNRVISFGVGGGAADVISGSARNLLLGLISDFGVAFAGRPGGTLNLDFVINNVTESSSSENAVVILDKTDSSVIMSLSVNVSTFPVIRSFSSNLTASINISNMNLTSPVSGHRPIISKGGNMTVTAISITDTTTITDLAYVENSTVLLPALMITLVTSVSKGSGGVVKVNQLIDY